MQTSYIEVNKALEYMNRIYSLSRLKQPLKGTKLCLACLTVFNDRGTLSNQKGFCSKECYGTARKFYIHEEKQKLRLLTLQKRYERRIGN